MFFLPACAQKKLSYLSLLPLFFLLHLILCAQFLAGQAIVPPAGSSSAARFTLSVQRTFEGGESARSDAGLEVSPGRESYDSGEVVTLTAIDNPEKGVVFVRWMPEGSAEKTISVVMDGDRSCTAIFREDFRVTKIYWFTGSGEGVEIPYDPDDLVTDVQILTMYPKPSTYMTVEFNRPVDTATVNGNLWVQELFERLDEEPLQRYAPDTVTFSTWHNRNTMLKMLLHNRETDLAVIKKQALALNYTDGILSRLGTPLANPGLHSAATEIGFREEYFPGRYLPLAVAPSPTLAPARITFGLDSPVPVRLEVFDLLGQRVAVAADQPMRAGEHVVHWDAGDLRSGVYRIRLTAGFNSESVPLIIQ